MKKRITESVQQKYFHQKNLCRNKILQVFVSQIHMINLTNSYIFRSKSWEKVCIFQSLIVNYWDRVTKKYRARLLELLGWHTFHSALARYKNRWQWRASTLHVPYVNLPNATDSIEIRAHCSDPLNHSLARTGHVRACSLINLHFSNHFQLGNWTKLLQIVGSFVTPVSRAKKMIILHYRE